MKATEADAPAFLALILAVDHPPNNTEWLVAQEIALGWTFRRGSVFIQLIVESGHVEIIWWVPLALWLTADGMGVLLEACEAVIAEYGQAANSWVISGQFDAPGATPAERRERSTKAAEIHKQWISDVEIRPDSESSYARGTSTVGKVIAQARAKLASM